MNMLEERLNPGSTLPMADAYQIIGDIYSQDGHARRFPSKTMLPIDEAVRSNVPLNLILKKDDTIIGNIRLSADNGLAYNRLTVTNHHIEDLYQGQGYDQRLFLELLKTVPPGVELTSHSNLNPYTGQKMWDQMVAAGVAICVGNQGGKNIVGEYRTVISSPRPKTSAKA